MRPCYHASDCTTVQSLSKKSDLVLTKRFSLIWFSFLFFTITSFGNTFTNSPLFDGYMCDNVTDGGEVMATETTGCLPGFDPGPIVNVTNASGGSGALEYMWMRTTNDPNSGNPGWIPLPSITTPSYDPPFLTQTTAFRRCARRAGCDTWEIESNDVIIYVVPCNTCDNVTDGGEIGYNQNLCGDEADPLNIVNTILPTGGSGNLEYKWYQSNVDVPFSNISPFWTEIVGAIGSSYDPGVITMNTYYVRVSRREYCDAYDGVSNVVKVLLHPDPTVTDTHTDITCAGFSDGSVTLNIMGGTPPYVVVWSHGAFGASLTGLSAGTYSARIRDAYGCWVDHSVTITEPSPLMSSTTSSNVSCFGEEDGSARVNPSGGTPGYTYNWSNGETTRNIDGLGAGLYKVTVEDSRGCMVFDSVEISQPARLRANITTTNITCFGDSDGSATASGIGGVPGYTFRWSTGDLTATITDLAPGLYTVTVTDSEGCTAVRARTVSSPLELELSIDVTNVSCNGAGDGSLTANPNGGTPPYSYLWNDPAAQITQTASGLDGGNYSVIVTDANGCKINGSETVNEHPSIQVFLMKSDVTCNGDNDGAIDATVSGGSGGYTYQWSHGPVTEDVTNLGPGDYTLEVTDSDGCTASESMTITEPNALQITVTFSDNRCNGDSNGSININASGGTGTLTVTYNPAQPGNNFNPTNLPAGSYDFRVEDENGCFIDGNVVIGEPSLLTTIVSATDVSCNGAADGTATATPSGGTPPYTYQWNDPASQVTQTATGLSGGNYTVIVTDANGCKVSESGAVSENSTIDLNLVGTNLLCNGDASGSINATVSGGAGGYTFQWSHGPITEDVANLSAGNYTLVVTDGDGCTATESIVIEEPDALEIAVTFSDNRCNGDSNGSINIIASGGTGTLTVTYNPAQPGNNFNPTNLPAGSYDFRVEDANGCFIDGNVVIGEPSLLTTAMSSTAVSCNGASDGTATATPSGGTPPYTYLWNDPASQDTQTATGLAGGDYTVTVTDANGCEVVETTTVTENPALGLVLVGTDVDCAGDATGSINATVNGGTGSYTFAWDHGPTTEDVSNLTAGTYTLLVTDSDNCTIENSITINEAGNLSFTVSSEDVLCNGDTDGSIVVTPDGGTPPYTVSWTGLPDGSTQNGLSAGTYTFTVTDANDCSTTGSATISEPALLTVSLSIVQPIECNGGAGTIEATVSGGTPGYTYTWSPAGPNDPVYSNATADSYTVTVTDANGCTATDNITLSEPSQIQTTTSSTPVVCNGDDEGTATVIASGGTPPYTYLWDDPSEQTTATATNLGPDTYNVTVTDSNGCIATAATTVDDVPLLECQASIVSDISAQGANDGSVTVNASGGTPGYTYLWSTGAVTQTIDNLGPGTYTVVVTDENGCTCTSSVTLVDKASLGNFVWSDDNGNGIQDPGEDGIEDVMVILTGTDANGNPVTDTTFTDEDGFYIFNDLDPGTYKVTFVTPDDYTSTIANAGSDEALDSDADPTMGGMTEFVTLSAGDTNLDLDAGFVGLGSIGDFVWEDVNGNGIQDPGEPGIGDVTVTLTGTDIFGNPYNITIETEPDGSYIFDDLPPGDYKVTFGTPDGYTTTQNDAGSNDAVDSDADPTMGGMTEIYTLSPGEDYMDFDAGYIQTGSIGDFVWEDSNGNGIQDPGEPGIGDMMVILTGTDICGNMIQDTVFTAPDGSYIFDDLKPGDYKVTFGWPSIYTPTTPNVGTNDALDSDADPAMGGMTEIYTLSPGEDYEDFDAGFIKKTKIGDYVWEDTDRDGIQDPDEEGINGIRVKLLQAGPDGEYCTADDIIVDEFVTTTGPDGNAGYYVFRDVCPGNYSIQVMPMDLPMDGNFSPMNQGGDDDSDSDVAEDTGKTEPFDITSGGPPNYSFDIGIMIGCLNVTDGGIIGGDETGCGPNFDPDLVTSLSLPSGGMGVLEYLWLESVIGSPFTQNSSHWTEIVGANGPTYDPGPIQYTTYYIRCARRKGCDEYLGESNIVVKTVALCDTDCLDNIYTAGLINGSETLCEGEDGSEITNAELPAGGNGTVEYAWMSTTDNPTDASATWIIIPGANGPSYDPGNMSVTTYYKRSAKTAGCSLFGNSNIVVKDVTPTPVATILSGLPSELCLGESLDFEAMNIGAGASYQWFFGTASVPTLSDDRIVNGVEWTTAGLKTIVLTVGMNGCTDVVEVQVNVIDDPNCASFQFNWNGFEAVMNDNNTVDLEWEFEAYLDDYYFTIERSTDGGVVFESLKTRLEDLSLGTFFTDEDPMPIVGKNIYRIKATNAYGYSFYSHDELVVFDQGYEKNRLYVYPNPVMNSNVNLNFLHPLQSEGVIQIISTEGILLQEIAIDEIDTYQLEIDLSDLPAGIYFLKVRAKNAPKSVIKISKITD